MILLEMQIHFLLEHKFCLLLVKQSKSMKQSLLSIGIMLQDAGRLKGHNLLHWHGTLQCAQAHWLNI